MTRSIPDRLLFIKMKARRADEHFHFLKGEIAKWARKPYTVVEETELKESLHIFRIVFTPTPELIPMLFGDFVCCLRSGLDQLAWSLAHLDPSRSFSNSEERQISFPIFTNADTWGQRRTLFPSAVAEVLDALQPYLRGDSFRDDPLWQLDKLWTLDKHRTTPTSHYDVGVDFGAPNPHEFRRYIRRFPDRLEMAFDLAWASKVKLKPQVSVEILFGEVGNFEIKLGRIGEINDFVRNDVIPRFTGFFP
jgi:hypothetical protein